MGLQIIYEQGTIQKNVFVPSCISFCCAKNGTFLPLKIIQKPELQCRQALEMIKYYMLVKKKRIISIFEFLMHDILKQPTYLDYSEIYLELPRGLRNYMYCCCLEENSKTCQKWPWGFECRLMRLVQFPKFRIASCGTLKSGVLQHGRTVTPFYVLMQQYNDKGQLNDRAPLTAVQYLPSYFLHAFLRIFLHLQPLCKLVVATCELDNHLRTICIMY